MDGAEPLETNYAGAVYGTILSMAVIAALSKDPTLSAAGVAGWTVATAVVFFIAHVYSSIVAAGFARPARAWALVRTESRREWPMVQGALLPAAVMLLAPVGPLGIINEDNASYVAVWTGVVMLIGAGLVIGRREQLGWSKRLIIGSINGAIGLMIVGLKVFVH